jgi:hypothetical protein
MATVLNQDLWRVFLPRLQAAHETGRGAGLNSTEASEVLDALFSMREEINGNHFAEDILIGFAEEVAAANLTARTVEADPRWNPATRLRIDQWDAVRRIAEAIRSGAYVFNGSECGTGKSACFLAALIAADVDTAIVAAPKSIAIDTWASESQAKPGEPRRWMAAKGVDVRYGLPDVLAALKQPRPQRSSADAKPAPLLCIVPYHEVAEKIGKESLQSTIERRKEKPDVILLDEAQDVKGTDSQAHGVIAQLIQSGNVKSAVAQSGEPMDLYITDPLAILRLISGGNPRFRVSGYNSKSEEAKAEIWLTILPYLIRYPFDLVNPKVPRADYRDDKKIILEKQQLEKIALQLRRPPKESRLKETLIRDEEVQAKLGDLLEFARMVVDDQNNKLVVFGHSVKHGLKPAKEMLEKAFPGKGRVLLFDGRLKDLQRLSQLDAFRGEMGQADILLMSFEQAYGLTLFNPGAANPPHCGYVLDRPYGKAKLKHAIAMMRRTGMTEQVVIQAPIISSFEKGIPSAEHVIVDAEGNPIPSLDEQLDGRHAVRERHAQAVVDGTILETTELQTQRQMENYFVRAAMARVVPRDEVKIPDEAVSQGQHGEAAA